MGRQRNSLQLKRKEESPEILLSEIEASELSETEFKILVKRKLNELTENYKEIQVCYKELPVSHMREKGHRNYQKESGEN